SAAAIPGRRTAAESAHRRHAPATGCATFGDGRRWRMRREDAAPTGAVSLLPLLRLSGWARRCGERRTRTLPAAPLGAADKGASTGIGSADCPGPFHLPIQSGELG